MLYNIVDNREDQFATRCHIVLDPKPAHSHYESVVEHINAKSDQMVILLCSTAIRHAIELSNKLEWDCTLFLYDTFRFNK